MKYGAIIVAAVVLIGALAWYFFMGKAPELEPPTAPVAGAPAEAPAEALGAELLEKTQNPLKGELPSTNPFKEAETNPFIDVYKNPFAQ